MPFDAQRLIVDRLSCRRGERLLFADLSVAVENGCGLALIGPNGVGKTSLLRILAGLLRPTSGLIRFEPQNDIPLAEQSHFIGVQDGLKANLTPGEHLDFWMATGDDQTLGPCDERNDDTRSPLAEWGMADLVSVPTAWLSTGQRRRIALSRLTCTARPIWLLDEPLNGLDAWAAGKLASLAAGHMASGGIVIAASHQPLSWAPMSTLDLGNPLPQPMPAGPAA